MRGVDTLLEVATAAGGGGDLDPCSLDLHTIQPGEKGEHAIHVGFPRLPATAEVVAPAADEDFPGGEADLVVDLVPRPEVVVVLGVHLAEDHPKVSHLDRAQSIEQVRRRRLHAGEGVSRLSDVAEPLVDLVREPSALPERSRGWHPRLQAERVRVEDGELLPHITAFPPPLRSAFEKTLQSLGRCCRFFCHCASYGLVKDQRTGVYCWFHYKLKYNFCQYLQKQPGSRGYDRGATMAPHMKDVYGVVDIGTLKVKTEVTSVEENGVLQRRYSSNTLTCFGVGLDENNGLVQKQYIQQTLAELKRVKAEFEKHGVDKFRVVSTHAMRRAANRESILERIRREVGFEVENISQEEEAKFFFLAVMRTFLPEDREYAVIDVGGGSVQVLIGTKHDLRRSHMMKTGTVSLHEKFVANPHDPDSFTTQENIEQMKGEILRQLMPLGGGKGIPLIYGSSMVIDIMQQIKIKLDPHEDSVAHPYKTYARHLIDFIDRIRPLTFRQREEQYPLPHSYSWGLDKAFLNAAAIAGHFGSPYIVPSNANIAQGIIYSMAMP